MIKLILILNHLYFYLLDKFNFDKVNNLLALTGYDPEYGARPIKREIRNIIEDKIVHVLEDDNCEEIQSDEVSLDFEDLNSDEKINYIFNSSNN